ncbi:hypothetical protein FEM48_Zijuj01G0247000 [Ziziphus jujuba var. spinosa]|uniref:Uncharacterized protein n=1 Tax=Ziziphus jujuba var. spinosa TaxID=714518 RepID=A0A978W4I8_ZIZJJ|nr:hypothetical protein FEM48_Zijuj01G0247000 [Ziziphus jujuba var. spinosa]
MCIMITLLQLESKSLCVSLWARGPGLFGTSEESLRCYFIFSATKCISKVLRLSVYAVCSVGFSRCCHSLFDVSPNFINQESKWGTHCIPVKASALSSFSYILNSIPAHLIPGRATTTKLCPYGQSVVLPQFKNVITIDKFGSLSYYGGDKDEIVGYP